MCIGGLFCGVGCGVFLFLVLFLLFRSCSSFLFLFILVVDCNIIVFGLVFFGLFLCFGVSFLYF